MKKYGLNKITETCNKIFNQKTAIYRLTNVTICQQWWNLCRGLLWADIAINNFLTSKLCAEQNYNILFSRLGISSCSPNMFDWSRWDLSGRSRPCTLLCQISLQANQSNKRNDNFTARIVTKTQINEYAWKLKLELHCVQKKNTHSHFLSYLHEWYADLNKNYSEYTQGTVDSENVEITYSLRPMTS